MNRVYLTEDGPDLLSTLAQEITLSADTKTYDLAANITGNFLGIKALFCKFPSDTVFTLMENVDVEQPVFQDIDSQPAAIEPVQINHPVLYHVYNFGTVRFDQKLPASTVLRVDFYRFGAPPDPTTNNTVENGEDLTEFLHDAIVCKATAHCLENLDDERTGSWETRAMIYLNDALRLVQKRVTGPKAHRGWRARSRRIF